MRWLALAVVGVVLNGAGLCFLGDAITRRTLEPGALNAYFWEGTLALVLINAGICLIAEAAKTRGR